MNCRRCGAKLRDDALFCHNCGQPKDGNLVCPNCGAEMKEGQRYCSECGCNPEKTYQNNMISPREVYYDSVNNVRVQQNTQMFNNTQATDFKQILANNKNKVIAIGLLLVQTFLINSDLISTSYSMLGIAGSEPIKLSSIITYPTGLFYFALLSSICILAYMIYKWPLSQKSLGFIPVILNLIYPAYVAFKVISRNDDALNGLLSTLGADVSIYPTFEGMLLIVCIIVAEIVLLFDAMKADGSY